MFLLIELSFTYSPCNIVRMAGVYKTFICLQQKLFPVRKRPTKQSANQVMQKTSHRYNVAVSYKVSFKKWIYLDVSIALESADDDTAIKTEELFKDNDVEA